MKFARALLLGVEDAGLERHRLPREKYIDSDGRTPIENLKKLKEKKTRLKYQGEDFRKYLCEVICYLRKTRTDEEIWPGQRAVDTDISMTLLLGEDA